MHTSIQGAAYGFRSPCTGIIFSFILKEGLSLTTEHDTEPVSPNLQPQFLYRCSLQLQGSQLTGDELGLRRSKWPAWSMPEPTQRELLLELLLRPTPAFSSWFLPWLSERPLEEPAVPNLLTLLLQSLKGPHYHVFGPICHSARPHTYTGICNPTVSPTSLHITPVVLVYADNFQLAYSYCYG